MIRITVNGERREIEGMTIIPDLLRALEIDGQRVAVAINGEVISRDRWGETTVREGDVVEVVRMVGGGA